MSDSPPQQNLLPDFEQAQVATIALMRDVVSSLDVGMTTADIHSLAMQKAQQRQIFTGWFHRPEIFLNRGESRRSTATALQPGTIVQIDLAPATENAFGDFGYSFTFQGDEHPSVHEAREVCKATCGFASRFKCVGELFVFAQSWSNNHRLKLAARHHIGHACLPREGLIRQGWPMGARLSIRLRRNQIQWYNPRRISGVYAINPPVLHQNRMVAFEEMVFVDGDQKVILGRASLDEVGTL